MAIQKGTGFTNLNRIMQANKGNKLGSAVSGGIQGQVSGVKSNVKSAQEQFQEEAEKNRLDTQQTADKRSEILGRFAPTSGSQPQASQLTEDGRPRSVAMSPTSVPSSVPTRANPETTQVGQSVSQAQAVPGAAQSPVSDEEIKEFTKFRTGTYTGPKELQDATTLYGKAQQAEELGNLARSEGGRQELLRRFVGGNNYTSGQRQLDSTLLGQKPGQLGVAARQARGSTDLVAGANAQAGGLAQEYANRAKAFGEDTVKKLGETKSPLDEALNKRVTDAQTGEDTRLGSLKKMQDLLVGKNPEFENLDQWTRSGLALQEAADKGYLSQADMNMLLGAGGKTGLLQRGSNLGLNMNQLINERLTNQLAQNIGRTGIASDDDIARLNALDRLAGKQGTDLEFLQGQGDFAEGKTGLNIGSLEEYIAKSEAEKARKDEAYALKLAQEQARYLNQAMAGGMQQVGGGMEALGGQLNQVLNPESYYNPAEVLTNYGSMASGLADVGIGSQKMSQQGTNAFLEGLTKLNVGGKSLADTEGGKQLLKAIELKSKMENELYGAGGQAKDSLAQGLNDVKNLDVGGAVSNLSGLNLAKNLGSNVTKNVSKSVGGAVKKLSGGGGIKISDEDLKTDIDYDPQDVQKFMDRLKPAAYDYKEKVQDSPLASKNRELGVMAQDLEKSKLGKESVENTDMGKIVDYDNLEPKMLASIAALNRRLKELEGKK